MQQCFAASGGKGPSSTSCLFLELDPRRELPEELLVLGGILPREADCLSIGTSFGLHFTSSSRVTRTLCAYHVAQIIDDDEINCQIPITSSAGSSLNIGYCTTLIQLAQMSSLVAKRLSSVRAFRAGAQALVRTVTELDEELYALKQSIEPVVSLGSPVNLNRLPQGMTLQQTIYLQIVYFATVLDIHTALTYPWSRSILSITPQPVLRSQVEKSAQKVAETCRSAILATEHIHFDASTPVP